MKHTIKNSNKKLGNKRAMTLVSLVMIIIILLILTSAITVSVISVSNNSKIVAFATDLSNIEQAVEGYYLENNELPKVVPLVEYTKNSVNSLSALTGTKNGPKLEIEIDANGDSNDKFFEVDLSKIKINSSTKGLKKDGDNDIYVVNSRNLRIYYVKGITVDKETCFSLTDKLIKSSNIEKTAENTNIISSLTVETDGIKIVKNNKEWTNNLDISVSSAIGENQNLRYSVAGTTPIVAVGNSFDLKLNVITITAIEGAIANFTNPTTPNKTIVVEKMGKLNDDSIAVIARATMNINNLDIQKPTVSDTATVSSFSDFNTISLSNVYDLGGLGIKEIRYEYSTKLTKSSQVSISIASSCVVTLNNNGFALNKPITFTTNGTLPTGITAGITYYAKPVDTNTFKLSTSINGADLNTSGTQIGSHNISIIEDYFNPKMDITETYLLASGKKVTGNILKLDKHISSVKMICVDNAGNINEGGIKTYTIPTENLIIENQSKFLNDVLDYKARVQLGGGEITNLSTYNSDIKFLKDNGLTNSLVLYMSTFGGVKKNIIDTVPYVQNIYDFKGKDSVQATPANQPKYTDKGIQFDGGTQYIPIQYSSQYDIREAITLSIWGKRTTGYSQLQDTHFLSRSPSWFFYDSYNSGAVQGDVYISGVRKYINTPVPFDGNWYQIVFTYDSSTHEMKIYKNGVVASSSTLTGLTNYLIDSSTNNFSNMGYSSVGRGWILNDALIFNKALSASEILSLYNQMKAKYL